MPDPIRPEDVPDSLVATARRATSGWTGMPEGDAGDLGEQPLRFVLAAVLTDMREQIAQQVDQIARIADAANVTSSGEASDVLATQAWVCRNVARGIRAWPGGAE